MNIGACFLLAVFLFPHNVVATADTPPVFTNDGKVILQGREYEIYPVERLRSKGVDVPDIPPEENAAWVYVQAMNALSPLPRDLGDAFDQALSGTWPEGEVGNQLANWIETNRESLNLARRASNMPKHYMPFFRQDTDALIAALLPTLTQSRQLARIMAADASHKMAMGDGAAAMESLLTAQRMANQIGHGKTLIEGLVGLAAGGLAQSSLVRLADSGTLDATSLKAAVAQMEILKADFPGFETMVRAEQQWANGFIDDIVELPGGLRMATTDFSADPGIAQSGGWHKLRAALSRVYFPDRAIKKHFKDHYDAVLRSTRREDGTVGEMIDEAALFARIPAWDIVSRGLVPSLSRCYEISLQGESNFIRTELRFAVEAYRADKGTLPPSLAALVPAYLSDIPPDPMTGLDFDYAPASVNGKPDGIAQLTRDSAEELRKKRRTPVIMTPRASKWRRYVMQYAGKYDLDDAQRAAAEAILRDIEARAATFERSQGQSIQNLINEGNTESAARKMGPLNELFDELKKRIDGLPSAAQRKAAREKTGNSEKP